MKTKKPKRIVTFTISDGARCFHVTKGTLHRALQEAGHATGPGLRYTLQQLADAYMGHTGETLFIRRQELLDHVNKVTGQSFDLSVYK